jgi:hypothetical protein
MPNSYVPQKGDTLLIPSGSDSNPNGKHLFVIVTSQCRDGFHLAVSISRIKNGIAYDPTCVLQAGEHPFVKGPSFIFYAKAAKLRHQGIIKCVKGWEYHVKDQCSPTLLTKIEDGMNASPFAPRWAKTFFNENR